MDFVHDALADGRPFRVLTVVDQWSRHSPILEVASSMSGATVSVALDRAIGVTRPPRSITVDHGTEFMWRALEDWAYRRGVQLDFIRPGKPVENAFIEAFNGRLRDECLNVHQFTSIDDAREKIEAWRVDYHARRPHSALGHLTPNELSPNVRLGRSSLPRRGGARHEGTVPCARRVSATSRDQRSINVHCAPYEFRIRTWLPKKAAGVARTRCRCRKAGSVAGTARNTAQ